MKGLTLESVRDYINTSDLGYTAKLIDVTKPNKNITGLQVYVTNVEDTCVIPIFYEDILSDAKDCDEVFCRILSIMDGQNPASSVSFETLMENLHQVSFRVVKFEGNESIVKQYVGRKFLDLYVYYHIPVIENGSVSVKWEHLDVLSVTEEDLYDMAITNLEDNKSFLPMFPMMVLSTENHMHGAAQILNTKWLDEIASTLDDDLVILPASIHEVIALPYNPVKEMGKDLYQMVKTVNATYVDETDVLNDHPYRYHRDTKQVAY